jgi:hypothetical protein
MSSTSSRLVLALIASVVSATGACGVFGSDDSSAPAETPAPTPTPSPSGEGGTIDAPKAPPVGGPASQNELTDQFGVFVANTGNDAGDGSHARPFATIQVGIDRAKAVGKRVYVCAGTYKESLVIADSISVIGGLDCTAFEWRTATGTSRVESPASPAAKAKDITSPTRLEGLELVAPNATAPSGSSIGLLADHAGALTVARSKITAGNAMKGDDGVEGTQLSNAASGTIGAAIPGAALCTNTVLCPAFSRPPGGAGGTNVCVGAPGHIGDPGGAGGSGGQYDVVQTVVGGSTVQVFVVHNNNAATFATTGAAGGKSGAAGVDGPDGAPAAAKGTLAPTGYTTADGANGTDGMPGSGGAGGDGLLPNAAVFTATPVGATYRGWGGGGGGAGGCPGLSGTAGKGGGASFAALLIDSPLTFDNTTLTSGLGGDAGNGTLGSAPLPGGLRNNPEIPGQNPTLAPALGHEGGRGGAAGISTNGSSGPSAAIAHSGAAPVLAGGSTMAHGNGGAAIAERSQVVLGVTKTLPATPAGAAQDILPF